VSRTGGLLQVKRWWLVLRDRRLGCRCPAPHDID